MDCAECDRLKNLRKQVTLLSVKAEEATNIASGGRDAAKFQRLKALTEDVKTLLAELDQDFLNHQTTHAS